MFQEVQSMSLKQRLTEISIQRRNSMKELLSCGDKNFMQLVKEYTCIKKEGKSKYDEILNSYLSEIEKLKIKNIEAYEIAKKNFVEELEDYEKTLQLELDQVMNKMKESLKQEFVSSD